MKSFLKIGSEVTFLTFFKCSMLPIKKSSSVKIDRADAPLSSYSFAFCTGSKFSAIIPALGEAFFISAIMASLL